MHSTSAVGLMTLAANEVGVAHRTEGSYSRWPAWVFAYSLDYYFILWTTMGIIKDGSIQSQFFYFKGVGL